MGQSASQRGTVADRSKPQQFEIITAVLSTYNL